MNGLRLGHQLRFFNYRDTTPLSHGQVDDTPYGGGAGMVIRVDVVDAALNAVYGPEREPSPTARTVLLTPSGRLFDDRVADELAGLERLTLLCGRYEGIDERVRENLADDAISIGRYVLSGGELPAMVIADARAAQAAWHARQRGERPGGVVLAGPGGWPGVSALHAPGELPRLGGSGGPAIGRSCPHPQLAAGAQRRSQRPSGLTGWARRSANITAPAGISRARRPETLRPRASEFMSELIQSIERRQLRRDIPRFREGDRVRVHFQVIEGTRRRTQVFEGVVIRLQGPGSRRTFTVRKLSFGIGVERTFPLHSPKVEQIEIAARGDVRRAKLYYLRGRIGRRARVRERRDVGPEEFMYVGPDGAEAPGAEARKPPRRWRPLSPRKTERPRPPRAPRPRQAEQQPVAEPEAEAEAEQQPEAEPEVEAEQQPQAEGDQAADQVDADGAAESQEEQPATEPDQPEVEAEEKG